MTVVLVRGNVDTDTHRRGPCEHEGRNQSDAPTSQETPETASNHRKLGGRHRTRSPSQPPKEPILPSPWARTTSLQNWETINITTQHVVPCLGSPRKLTHWIQHDSPAGTSTHHWLSGQERGLESSTGISIYWTPDTPSSQAGGPLRV